MLAIGPGSALLAPMQMKWGMRPVFLLAAVRRLNAAQFSTLAHACRLQITALIGQIWAGASKLNFASLVAARVVQGLGMGAYFNNVPAAIEAIYFVHERGSRMALWNLALIG